MGKLGRLRERKRVSGYARHVAVALAKLRVTRNAEGSGLVAVFVSVCSMLYAMMIDLHLTPLCSSLLSMRSTAQLMPMPYFWNSILVVLPSRVV